MCLARRWPVQPAGRKLRGKRRQDIPGQPEVASQEGEGEEKVTVEEVDDGIPWHVDGGPSICFMALTLEPWNEAFETFSSFGDLSYF